MSSLIGRVGQNLRVGSAHNVSSCLSLNVVPNTQFVRNVSAKSLRIRMVAVGNIKKITKAMKMVASAKLKKSEEQLKVVRLFAKPVEGLFKSQEKGILEEGGNTFTVASTTKSNNHLIVVIGADRGLCGSVNGTIVRSTRNKINGGVKAGVVTEYSIFGVGEKARSGLERHFGKHFTVFGTDYTKLKRATFKQAAQITDYFLKIPYESGEVVFNRFKNLMAFDALYQPFSAAPQTAEDLKLSEEYELEGGSDILENLNEFRWASRFFHLFQESETTELSQRVNAMSNSNKNAGNMLDKLRLKYNRQRQAKITTELVEIISGAESVKGAK